MNRSKRSAINIFFTIINNLVKVFLPFITRTIIIYRLGEEYVGLGGLFTSVLSILNMSELGFSTAVTYFMYRPISGETQEDREYVNKLFNFIRKIYLIIGTVILLVGLILCPFIKYMIKGEVPQTINVYLLYLLYLLNTISQYFFWGYCRSVFIAGQRNDIISKIEISLTTITGIIQVLCLLLKPDYYLYVIWMPIGTIVINIIIYFRKNKYYPGIVAKGNLSLENRHAIFSKVKALFTNSIGTVIFTSSDNIVISAFIGLTMVTIYGNYYKIASILLTFTYTVFGAITPIFANKFYHSAMDEIEDLFGTMHFWICMISGIFCTGFYLLIQPFMLIWMGPLRLLDESTVILIIIMFYINQVRRATMVIYETHGLWDKSPYISGVAGLINLFINIILVNLIGINGIVISTIISMALVSFPRETYVLYHDFFNKGARKYLLDNIKYFLMIVLNILFCKVILSKLHEQSIFDIVIKSVLIVFASFFLLVIIWRRNKYFKYGINLVKKVFIKE